MKLLAIDTATERCSVALLDGEQLTERSIETPRAHADLVLPMVESVLSEAGVRLQHLDALAYGRGPGAFTGVRIAVGVAQGLAFGAQLPTIGISDLAAVAQQAAGAAAAGGILVCMDARMGEVYWGKFAVAASGLVQGLGAERVDPPEAATIATIIDDSAVLAGTGFKAYPQLAVPGPGRVIYDTLLPRAREVAVLARAELQAGRTRPAHEAEPVYLRDRVTFVKGS
jgi:tRNA threonylcarbamoyladenosine biosynthesis protein TsaB